MRFEIISPKSLIFHVGVPIFEPQFIRLQQRALFTCFSHTFFHTSILLLNDNLKIKKKPRTLFKFYQYFPNIPYFIQNHFIQNLIQITTLHLVVISLYAPFGCDSAQILPVFDDLDIFEDCMSDILQGAPLLEFDVFSPP